MELNNHVMVDITEPSIFNWGDINPDDPSEKKVHTKHNFAKNATIRQKTLKIVKSKGNILQRLATEAHGRNKNAKGCK
jgi:hypothetical protein